jgi:hypothetical protein
MLVRDGVAIWNLWRKEERGIRPDLSEADLSGANLFQAHLLAAHLRRADLSVAGLREADLSGADLSVAGLREASLIDANLSGEDLTDANLSGAHLRGADLTRANLTGASFLRTDMSGATLTGCTVYGISAWDLELEGAVQTDLRITPQSEESAITVDNLEVAQFLYVLLHNQKVRDVLDTITSKVVLILGRFSDERKPVLDALREALRQHPNGYIPVLFDFERQHEKPVLETVKTLASLARFVIADLTDPNMVRAELTYITANLPTVPVQPVIESGAKRPTEYETWARYQTFLPVFEYTDPSQLLASLTEKVITPVEGHVVARRLADADSL